MLRRTLILGIGICLMGCEYPDNVDLNSEVGTNTQLEGSLYIDEGYQEPILPFEQDKLELEDHDEVHACAHRDAKPMTREQAVEAGLVPSFDIEPDPGEEKGSVFFEKMNHDPIERGRTRSAQELRQAMGGGMDFDSMLADTDGDGWYDNPINQRRKLILTKIKAYDEAEDVGSDEFYLFVDDVRHPNGSMSGYWSFNHGTVKTFNRVLAQRTQGINLGESLQTVTIRGRERDGLNLNNWDNDDTLLGFTIDLMDYDDGETFSIRRTHDDWDYKFWFRLEIDYFADPNPNNKKGDADNDGISEKAEFAVSRDFGGITDPEQEDILVEVDWMNGHALETNAKRKVKTIYARRGYNLRIYRDEKIPTDSHLTKSEAKDVYLSHFTNAGYNSFRYAVMGEENWLNASGVQTKDVFFVDNSTWFVGGWAGGAHGQAATFAHELGHAVGLNKNTFWMIDKKESQNVWNYTVYEEYQSSMNYLYQAFRVDYSDEVTTPQYDHDDWNDVDASHNLKIGNKKKFAKAD